MNLLSDAAQSETWPAIKPQLVKGKVRDDPAER
jgi:ketol-acid reductoisomerase